MTWLSMDLIQAKILEWVAIPPLGDLPDPRIESVFLTPPALQVDSLPLSHLVSPYICVYLYVNISMYMSNYKT